MAVLGGMFFVQFVGYVCVCEQNSSRTVATILMQFSPKGCLSYRTGLNPIDISDLGSKVKVSGLWKSFAKNSNVYICVFLAYI